MSKPQKSIASFFGGGKPSSSSGPKQTSIASAFGATSAPAAAANAKDAKRKKTEDDDDDDEVDIDDDVKVVASSDKKKKKRIIEDDDDDDDDDDKPQSSLPAKSPAKSAPAKAPAPASTKKADPSPAKKSSSSSPSKIKQSSIFAFRSTSSSKSASSSSSSSSSSTKIKTDSQPRPPPSTSSASSSSSSSSSSKTPLSKIDTPTSYLTLVKTLDQIDSTSSRLEKQKHLTLLFTTTLSTRPSDLEDLIYLASNTVAPSYDCLELGVGDSFLQKSIGESSGLNPNVVKEKYRQQGDLGLVAMNARSSQKTLNFGANIKGLAASEVLKCFRDVAVISGSKSTAIKVELIKKILVRCSGLEAKYVIRGLQGKLRIGLAKSTVLVCIGHCFASKEAANFYGDKGKQEKIPEPSDEEIEAAYPKASQVMLNPKSTKDEKLEASVNIIKRAHSEYPSYTELLKSLLKTPLPHLHLSCHLQPGVPVEPMLAKPTKSVQEVLKRLNGVRFTLEYKYDGERAQVHLMDDGNVKCFSRNLLNTSEKFPEVPEFVKLAAAQGYEARKAKAEEAGEGVATADKVVSFILDAEVVAYNSETEKLVPFQVLSTRKKNGEADGQEAKVKVIVQAFDLMFLNGQSLLNSTLFERRRIMRENFAPVKDKFRFAVSLDVQEDGDTEAIELFLDESIKNQCEGLMVKTLDLNSTYQPSQRSLNWLKLKKDYLEGIGDSLDLVPLGAYYGKGKRTGTYGAYLLGCYNADTEEYQSICKCGTGFSDADLLSLMEGLKDEECEGKPEVYVISDTLACDVWFNPAQVWEVKAADLSTSSTHKGALGTIPGAGSDRGIGLRFPRFERTRPDKKCEQATGAEQVLEMYLNQDSVKGQDRGKDEDDDDDDGI